MIHLVMSAAEKALFEGFARCARRYLEFGSGGSTCLAASLVGESVTSIDSSRDWLAGVRAQCVAQRLPVSPHLVHVDIGELREWGWPKDDSAKDRWTDYHTAIWSDLESRKADFYLVDGRFRVACFMQVMLHAQPGAFIAIHDFASRPEYHVVREVGREIATADNLSIFLRRADYSAATATKILAEYSLRPD